MPLEESHSLLLELVKSHAATSEAKLDAIQKSLDGVNQHLAALNSKTASHSKAIARLNLVVFSIGGTVATLLFGAFLQGAAVKDSHGYRSVND